MLLSINKPAGITSHDVVDRVRTLTGERRVGHGGTLDPMASGVLMVGVGRENTRKLTRMLKNADKEYEAVIELGKVSSTGDTEGKLKVSNTGVINHLTQDAVKAVLKRFEGKIKQTPPTYSAVKIKGVPAYKLARSGKTPALKEREILIKSIDLAEFTPPLLKIRVTASSGTYIRKLAEDIGAQLKSGAYLKQLVRTRVADFTLADSKSLGDLEIELKKA